MERSLEMVVGLLGILKAGGAYVPLDPSAPPVRLAHIVQDAGITVLLTQASLRPSLPEFAGAVLTLDSGWETIAQMPGTNVESGVTAEHLAYLMYTSGSTGLPKGTSVCQRNVVRLVMNTNYLEGGPEETFLQFAPLAFDASTFELWGSLLHGAKLVIAPPHQLALEELGHCLQEHGISTLWLTAALFHQMVDNQLEALRGVRQLLAGGDVLSVLHVQGVVANLREDGRLINGYGPTENTTFTCCHIMTSESSVETAVPIGRPIANTQVYVLDRYLEPVPVGVYGELHIGGDGLARNYLQRPALTAEKWVPHPFSHEPGARLYRTGDVVRYRSDGVMEFKGRRDHQVKMRGYRIELGEIEAVLTQHPGVGVQESVVLVREDEPGDKRLVGYVVSSQGPAPTVLELREFLQARLPEYMVPGVFLVLQAFPLTSNGKIDRKRLPIPERGRGGLETEFIAPQTPIQIELAEIWREVLKVEQVGVHDNFFELGGHSLLATQVVSRIKHAFSVEVTVRQFFEMPTIALIAGTLKFVLDSDKPNSEISNLSGEEYTEVKL
jgi:amino acid adenylation domain-containing protein